MSSGSHALKTANELSAAFIRAGGAGAGAASGARVPIASPALPPAEKILDEFAAILESRQLTNGQMVERLEREAALFLDVPECVAVSSCTSGLMLVQRCLGLEGEVILPSFTFCATGQTLLWNGLEPVFVDCGPDDFNVSPAAAEQATSARTAAIVGVHIFGCPADVETLREIALRNRVPLLFDGAHAFGTTWKGQSVAKWGNATVFSLSPTKTLVAGEGGLIATHDRELARRLRQARNYGKGIDNNVEMVGLNARMSEFQAALAVLGLTHVDQGIRKRARLAAIYRERFRHAAGLRTQAGRGDSTHKDFAVLVDQPLFGASRDEVEAYLAERNVEVRRYFDPPLHCQKLFQTLGGRGENSLPITEQICSQILCLPMHSDLAPETAGAIADSVISLGSRRSTERSSSAGAGGT